MTDAPGPLAGVRAIDLTDEKGAYATRLLADFGAEVIRVEPPTGDPLRRRGPFVADHPDPNASLTYWHSNVGKRAVAIDPATPDGRSALLALIGGADILVESQPVGTLAAWDLAADRLREMHPGLILTSISLFGQTGPRATWRGGDLTAWATGGVMALCGDPGRPPLRGAGGQALHFTGLWAAAATLAALSSQRITGRGQYLDVSMQEAVASQGEAAPLIWAYYRERVDRAGSGHPLAVPFDAYPVRDGHCLIAALSRRQWELLAAWLAEEGADRGLAGPEWNDPFRRLAERDFVNEVISAWAAGRSREAIFREGQARRIPTGAVQPLDRVAADPHLRARDFFVEVPRPGGAGTITLPGPAVRFSRTPLPRGRPAPDRPAARAGPAPDAHDPSRGGPAGSLPPPDTRRPTPPGRPLAGLRVADFTWVLAGPFATRLLADLGAEVIKLEARGNGCLIRIFPPFVDRVVDPDHSGQYPFYNRNKQSITIDLKHPRGVDVARRIVAVSDVAIDNFSAGVMEDLGLGYDMLARDRPDLIQVSLSGFGRSGPYARYLSYHATLMALSGHSYQTAYDATAPVGYGHSYSDFVGGLLAAVATLAALEHRQRTGEGQFVDLSQFEAVAGLTGPALLDHLVNGRLPEPIGNRVHGHQAGPQGAYPARGADRWIVLEVTEEAEWEALCRVAGRLDWAADPRFRSNPDRFRHHAALDAAIGAWTAGQEPHELVDRLQAAGVPAGVIQTGEEILDRDPQIRHRGYYRPVDHPLGAGAYPLDRGPVRWSDTEIELRRASLLGEQTEAILRDLLGYSDEEIALLVADEAV